MYTVELIPAGLHARLSITLEPSTNQIHTTCPLFLQLSLPPSFIGDRFELSELHTKGHLGAYEEAGEGGVGTIFFKGESDLERPVYQAKGSEFLIRLQSGKGKERASEEVTEGEIKWEIPLHLRYQVPVESRWVEGKRNDTVQVELNSPLLFWACQTEEEVSSLASTSVVSCPNVFDYPPLLNSSSLQFLTPTSLNSTFSCPPSLSLPPLSISAPTGVMSDLGFVESMNFLTIWAGMIGISWGVWKLKKRLMKLEEDGVDKKTD